MSKYKHKEKNIEDAVGLGVDFVYDKLNTAMESISDGDGSYRTSEAVEALDTGMSKEELAFLTILLVERGSTMLAHHLEEKKEIIKMLATDKEALKEFLDTEDSSENAETTQVFMAGEGGIS